MNDLVNPLLTEIARRHPTLNPRYTLAPFGNYIAIHPNGRTDNVIVATISVTDSTLEFNSHNTGKITIDLTDPNSIQDLHNHLLSLVTLMPDEPRPPLLPRVIRHGLYDQLTAQFDRYHAWPYERADP